MVCLKILKIILNIVKNNKAPGEFYKFPCEEIKKEEYKLLLDSPDKKVYKAYYGLKDYWKLQNRKDNRIPYLQGLPNSFWINWKMGDQRVAEIARRPGDDRARQYACPWLQSVRGHDAL